MTLESEALALRRKGYLQNAVLSAVAVSGILALALIAPNTLQLLGGMTRGRKRFNEQARSAIGRLIKKGFIVMGDDKKARITTEGRRAIALLEQRSQLQLRSQRKRRWDHRWRLVIFDVPEYRKAARNRLRLAVQDFGFLRIQDSVWVYPYDCEELIILLKAELRIGKDVLYAIVEKIENDAWIREHFKLSR